MTRPRSLLVLRLAALLATGFSAALWLDARRPEPAFCSVGSGCARIRQLGYGAVAGVPVSAVGLFAFTALFALSLGRGRLAARLTAYAALAGGVAGVALLGLQALVIGVFCKLCVVVELSSIAAASAAFLAIRPGAARVDERSRLSWGALWLLSIGLPVGLSELAPSAPVPPGVAALLTPGELTVVEFSDFECPFCRLAHPALAAACKAAPRPVRLVRKTMPLAMHPHARDASRAYLCAVAEGKGEAMADRLFSQDDLSPAGCEAAAEAVGIPPEKLRACVKSPATDAAVDADVAFVRGAGFEGLPCVWINREKLLGSRPEADYQAALARAARGETGEKGRLWPLAAVVVFALGLLGLGASARPAP